MAIIQTSIPLMVSTVVNGIALTIQPSGQVTAGRANNNYAAKQQATHRNNTTNRGAFGMTDETVVSLDAQYDALEDKSPWDDYAAGLTPGWGGCSNCVEVMSGKKAYRIVNLNRIMAGLSTSADIPAETNVCDIQVTAVQFFGPPRSPTNYLVFGAGTVSPPYVIQALQFKGLGNPVISVPGDGFFGPVSEGSPYYGFWSEVYLNAGFDPNTPDGEFRVPICAFWPDGGVGLGPFNCECTTNGS